jgi:hypothetical protein
MAAEELAVQVGVAPACQALGVSRATFYRRERPLPGHQQPRPTPARGKTPANRMPPLLAAPLGGVDHYSGKRSVKWNGSREG